MYSTTCTPPPTRRARSGALAAALAAGLAAAAPDAASAGGATTPGFTAGLPIYALLPEGLYYINQTSSSWRDIDGLDVRVNANIFFFYYQTPWELLNGNLSFVVAPTVVDVTTSASPNDFGFYNTYLAAQLSWAVPGIDGLRVGYRIGGYVPQDGPVAFDYGVIEQRAGFTYLKDGLSILGNFIYGTPVGTSSNDVAPDYFVADFHVLKSFDKWTFGVVGYASNDITSPMLGYAKQSQIALGGLVGYDFGGATLQLKLTHDVYEKNYGGQETVFWTNLIIPLWTAPAAAPRTLRK